MAAASGERPKIVIVRRKKVSGGGHHGGSWKVAYADFVTAMMAFFMVMWILGMDDNMKKAIEGYFSNPVGYKKGFSSGSSPISSGSSPSKIQSQALRMVVRNYEEKRFGEIATALKTRIEAANGLSKLSALIEVVVTKDGLRIELIEGGDAETFFRRGSAEVKPEGMLALQLIAWELSGLSNPVAIEGHTDGAPLDRDGYTNWELSADRANAARRALEGAGMSPRRIVEVRGLADRRPRDGVDPLSASNRRVSIILPFTTLPTPAERVVPPAGAPHAPAAATSVATPAVTAASAEAPARDAPTPARTEDDE